MSRFNGAPTQGRRVELRELRVDDAPILLAMVSRSATVGRWRLAGHALAPDAFVDYLWQSANLNMVMCRRDNRAVLGLVQAYGLNLRSRTCSVALLVDEKYWSAGWPIEGLVLFLNYLFAGLRLRKLYFYVPAFNIVHFGSVTERWLVEEGVLRRVRDSTRGCSMTFTCSASGATCGTKNCRCG